MIEDDIPPRSERSSTSPFDVRLWTRRRRLAAAACAGLARVSLPVVLALVLWASDPPITTLDLVVLLAVLGLLPAAAAAALRRGARASAELASGALVITAAARRVEIPIAGMAGPEPWRLPWPEPGLALRMRSGRRLGFGIATADPAPLLRALAEAGPLASAAGALSHPSVVYAGGRRRASARALALKFPVFALLPTGIFFNAHQHIAFGGTLGQYYRQGLGPYLGAFGLYWLTVTLYLVLYAGAWRWLGELAALGAAWAAPSAAPAVRRAVEWGCAGVYYLGVPALVAVRFLV